MAPKTKTYGLGGGVAGTSELEDDNASALLFESADGADYLKVSTDNGAEGVTVTVP